MLQVADCCGDVGVHPRALVTSTLFVTQSLLPHTRSDEEKNECTLSPLVTSLRFCYTPFGFFPPHIASMAIATLRVVTKCP